MTTTATDGITPGERRNLGALVRRRMRVLRADVKQRENELIAEAEARLTERFAAQDKLVTDARERAAEIAREANRQLQDLITQASVAAEEGRTLRCHGFSVPFIGAQTEDRTQLRRAMESGVKARVRAALLELERQEADLLEELAVGAIESSAAKAFMSRIPTAAQLVPSSRLAEIEAQFDEQQP